MNLNTIQPEAYREELFESVIPFWETHSPDRSAGGYFTCLDRDGTVFDTDKFIWLQARQVWMFSHLYRTVERRESYWEMARLGADFLLRYGRADDGRWYFSLLRDGTPQVAPYNIFADCFVAMALAEYAEVKRLRAKAGRGVTGKSRSGHRISIDSELSDCLAADELSAADLAELACETWARIQKDKHDPKGRWNKVMPGGRGILTMALPMIQLNMAEIFESTIGLPVDRSETYTEGDAPAADYVGAVAREAGRDSGAGIESDNSVHAFVETQVNAILDRHVDTERRLVFERVFSDGSHPEGMDGRLLNPGHAAEAMWMVIEAGERYGRQDWIERASEALLWALESGHDSDYDGLFYYRDAEGFPPEKLEYEMKLWWVHLEATYACLAAADATGRREFTTWYEYLEGYTWDHFRDPEHGEWYGYLHRDGTPATLQKGGKWKGCFHLPRILLRMARRLERIEADRAAVDFVANETQFHLGRLVTERSHSATRTLSETISRKTSEGLEQLLSVDRDMVSVAEREIGGESWNALAASLADAAVSGKRIRFSGCGSTGRLAAVLEVMWRRCWFNLADFVANSESGSESDVKRLREVAECVAGIITGGDRALVKSVESFEDYQEFGRRQLRDVGIGKGDVCVAISEGGETSSVIGTAEEAREAGATVYFVYNNPNDVLVDFVQRSKQLIEATDVTSIELNTGPMAIAGSTRMQATSIEMLVVGSALEKAFEIAAGKILGAESALAAGAVALRPEQYTSGLTTLLDSLSSEDGTRALAEFVEYEQSIYESGGLVTYLCDHILLDVFSDTSERTPTFNLPPMRGTAEPEAKPSWAFPKHAHLETEEAWQRMLLHRPRGLDWNLSEYQAMNAPTKISSNLPQLSERHIYEYRIGAEGIAERHGFDYSVSHPGAIIGLSIRGVDSHSVDLALDRAADEVPNAARLHVVLDGPADAGSGISHSAVISDDVSSGSRSTSVIRIPARISPSSSELFEHLATKLVLNTVSTATMARMGRVRGNFMIQMDPTNKKLIDRGTRIIAGLCDLSYDVACRELHRTGALGPAELDGRSRVAATLDRLGAG